MKKILFICSALFLIGCGSNNKDCNCTQQRWERKVVRTIGSSDNPSTLVSATEWKTVGNPEPAGTDDCSKNGSILKSESKLESTNPSNNTQTNLESQYRVTCQ